MPIPELLAREFERAGAAAVSVLVDERFAGSVDDLRAARAAASLPLLAKGFFRDPDELAELKRSGADAVLLLLRDLDDEHAARLMAVAASSASMRSSRPTTRTSSSGRSPSAQTRSGSTPATSRPSDIDRDAQLDLVAASDFATQCY